MNVIEAAFREMETEQLKALYDVADESAQTVKSIVARALTEHVSDGRTPQFEVFVIWTICSNRSMRSSPSAAPSSIPRRGGGRGGCGGGLGGTARFWCRKEDSEH